MQMVTGLGEVALVAETVESWVEGEEFEEDLRAEFEMWEIRGGCLGDMYEGSKGAHTSEFHAM